MDRASTAPLTTVGHLWACRSLMGVWVPSYSGEWVFRPPELAVGRASMAHLTIEGHLWACRSLLGIWVPSLWGMSYPLLRAPYLSSSPHQRGSPMSVPLPSWASEFPLILRVDFSALQSSLSVELALLPSPRGSLMSMPLPSERLSPLSFWKMSFSAPQSSVIGLSLCWSS